MTSTHSRRRLLVVLVASALIPSVAPAAVFCAVDEASLTLALVAAGSNGESDEIRIHIGEYDARVPDPDGWQIDLGNGTTGLMVAGGYVGPTCSQRQMDPALTVLDGHDAVRPLTILTSGSAGAPVMTSIEVSGLTFRNGRGDAAGGLKISDGGPIYGGTILVERNLFQTNVATVASGFDGAPGALYAATDGPTGFGGGLGLVVRNNVFDGNRGPNPAALYVFSNNDIAITGNTFVDNAATDGEADERLVFDAFSLSSVELANNIFFANASPDPMAFDLRARTQAESRLYDTIMTANSVQRIVGAALEEEGTQTGDPGFVDFAAGDYRLAATSARIDAGVDAPLGGLGAHDAAGRPRRAGTRVDIGAIESDVMLPTQVFVDGFEPALPRK